MTVRQEVLKLARLIAGQSPTALDALAFELPDPLPSINWETAENPIGTSPLTRACCALGLNDATSIDNLRKEPHQYRKAGGGIAAVEGGGGTGFVYTRRGGLIDIGHARDVADSMRCFAVTFRNPPHSGIERVVPSELTELSLSGSMRLRVHPRSGAPDLGTAALVGAALAYSRALWHEIASWFSTLQRYSAFSPEDNFSNALGALVGFRAFLSTRKGNLPVDYDKAVDEHLFGLLRELGAVDQEVTEDVIDYIDGFWWTDWSAPHPTPRKNLNAVGKITPWLITDVAVPGKTTAGAELRKKLGRPKPATIELPTRAGGKNILDWAQLEVVDAGDEFLSLLDHPIGTDGVLWDIRFGELADALESRIRSTSGFFTDPGPAPSP